MRTNKIPLSQLQAGEKGIVEHLSLDGDIHRRLQELGLVEGTEISCLRVAPMGSPIAYRFRGAVVALRRCDASKIEVEPWD